MSVRHDPLSLAETQPTCRSAAARSCTDRNFNLPVALYAGFFGLFLAYLGVMAFGFFDPQMIIPIAVFVLITIAFYVLPMLWTKVGPENSTRSMRVDQMMAIGVDRTPARQRRCCGRPGSRPASPDPAVGNRGGHDRRSRIGAEFRLPSAGCQPFPVSLTCLSRSDFVSGRGDLR